MKPRVFVSHTDGEDVAAREFRSELSRGLEEKGFDVLLDEERLELDDAWRRQLLVWLLDCHAGVILVSEKALAGNGTPWMQFEATVLVMRRVRSELPGAPGAARFPVIPVLLPPVKAEQFRQGWLEPLALGEIQSGKANAQLVKKIAKRLEPLKAGLEETPLQRLQDVIRPWLKQVDAEVLRQTGDVLGAKTKAWVLDTDVPDQLTCELLKADLDGVAAAMEKLAPQLRDHAQQLLDILIACWVDPAAAVKLPPITRSERRVVGINASRRKFTGDTYVQRAWTRHPAPVVLYVTEAGERDTEGATREILSAIRQRYTDLSSDQDALKIICEAAGDTAFHVALPWLPDQQTVQALTTRFPDATLLFLSADEAPEERSRCGVEFLSPEIDQAHEGRAFLRYVNLKDLVERS